ncbi:hypothetical protein SCHPADRAFT_525323 [Schizopora paradoxa]|uniref:DUF6534 domain-containing protein n=1 Tax=Schizopora paradoxa TaxID=27342 RepID=A0A0H2RLL9_9AGAM|nr:hypothetical protein SCHPADRAFT_525323 [Schizopora paradoxa]
MADLAATVPALDNTMGCLFVGVMIAMGLWGAGSLQMYYYFNRYQKDPWTLKAFVVVVWLLDTAHQALISHSTYTYLITNYAKPAFLGVIETTLLVEVIFSALICLCVQSFLVLRVWRLSHGNWLITGVLLALIMSEFVLSLIYVIQGFPLKTFANLPHIFGISRAMNIMSFISDLGITVALTVLLNASRTGYERSETVINKLIVFTINTGLLTALCAVMSLVTIQVLPNTFVYILFFLTISRLYTNTLLATLNARNSIRSGFPDNYNSMGNVSLSIGRFATINPGATFDDGETKRKSMSTVMGRAPLPSLSVKVDTETLQHGVEIPEFRTDRPLSMADSDTQVGDSAAASTYEQKMNFMNSTS